ncbi:uncharacterized protein F54H12.2-like [Centruroides sculpturatus]|uniref:uncharacterized protein F54H12.2-like n=1 Tax=Centruroides sculpturatus TaxID=218467 RepID=UPI000C6EA066|nr:uncharacterized protein F54H12.2-like [Centruroides sculpturatus]
MQSDFFVTLISNASMELFPENKQSHFTVKMSPPIDLRGKWVVGLSEVIIPRYWFNISNHNNDYTITRHKIRREKITDVTCEIPLTTGDENEGTLFHWINKNIVSLTGSKLAEFVLDEDYKNVNYPYRAILDALLFNSKEVQETFLTSALFFKDTARQMDSIYPLYENNTNYGLVKRFNISKESRIIDLMGRLHIDLANQPKLLTNHVDLRIKLERSEENFALMADNDNYKNNQMIPSKPYTPDYTNKIYARNFISLFEDTGCIHHHKSINISYDEYRDGYTLYCFDLTPDKSGSENHIGIEKALQTALIKLPFRRTDVKVFTLTSGIQSTSISNVVIGQLPYRITLGLVSNSAFNGNVKRNPFNFKNYDLNYICLSKDNQMIPSKPYTPDYTNSIYAKNIISLFEDTRCIHHQKSINISYDEYRDSYTLYCFDLTPDKSGSESHVSVNELGNISVELKFSKAIPETINVNEYRYVVEITSERSENKKKFWRSFCI